MKGIPAAPALTLALVLATSTGAARADAIDDYIDTEMTRQHIPGLALGIMRHGQLIRAQGYGFANLEHRVPVHADTVFKPAPSACSSPP